MSGKRFQIWWFQPKKSKISNYQKKFTYKKVSDFMALAKNQKYQKYQISIKISKYHDIFQNIMIFSILAYDSAKL